MTLAPTNDLSISEALDELARYLRPPGQGIHTVSTGRAEQVRAQRQYLGQDVPEWRQHLEGLRAAPLAILAVPSDAGAGIVRGAAHGPLAIRLGFGKAPVFELGDVRVVPHFIEDAMLSELQRIRSQDAMYPELSESIRRSTPVSPLDLTARVYQLVRRVSPQTRILLLGGDHTVSHGAMLGLLDAPQKDVGILHFDAHTDLLAERLGVRVCFATWAHHANILLGRGRRLLQIGLRASARSKEHWEAQEDVRQIWAPEARALDPTALATEVVRHFRSVGVSKVYISNDIDGTDDFFAAACGTPEPLGLSPASVIAAISAVGRAFEVIGADVVEVAPGLSLDHGASARTVFTAVRYARAALHALSH